MCRVEENVESGGKYGKWKCILESGGKIWKVEVKCRKWKQNVESGGKL